METSKKLTLVLSAALLALVLVVGPAGAAAEGGGAEAGEGESKIQLATNQHEFVGLILIGVLVIGGLAALVNARKQLRGERDQATGEWRWR